MSDSTSSIVFSIPFLFGLLAVGGFAWQRFNVPSFPYRELLPRALIPLRYLFQRTAYGKARLSYAVISLFVYCMLVLAGRDAVFALQSFGVASLPTDSWPILVALVLVVIVPYSGVRWLAAFEELLRRWAHEWYLVPSAVQRMIGILEDADYQPSRTQLNAVPSPLRQQLQGDLKLPRSSLRYRWARARMLMQLLRQMRAGADHTLKRIAFEPFQSDFQAIYLKYRALEKDIAAHDTYFTGVEDNLDRSITVLLRRIYIYISWAVRYQANTQQDIDEVFENLGFRIPALGDRRLFDILTPPIVLVALITVIFSLTIDAMVSAQPLSSSVLNALISTTATSIMYGWAIAIALTQRAAQIEQKVWRHGSPRRLLAIGVRAGFTTVAVIIATTILLRLPAILRSLPELAKAIGALSFPQVAATDFAPWNLLLTTIAGAMPWYLVGATMSIMLAYFLDGDIRRTNTAQRARDAIFLGLGLAFATSAAQLIQTSFSDALGAAVLPLIYVPSTGLAGFFCGAVIGFMVPGACRQKIITPADPRTARTLRNLLRQAAAILGSLAAAENWVFTPHNELLGITPAEAVQYPGLETGVWRLVDSEAPRNDDRPDRGDPVVIDGDALRTRSNDEGLSEMGQAGRR